MQKKGSPGSSRIVTYKMGTRALDRRHNARERLGCITGYVDGEHRGPWDMLEYKISLRKFPDFFIRRAGHYPA